MPPPTCVDKRFVRDQVAGDQHAAIDAVHQIGAAAAGPPSIKKAPMPVAYDQEVCGDLLYEGGNLSSGLAAPQLGDRLKAKLPQPRDALFEHRSVRFLLVSDDSGVRTFGQPSPRRLCGDRQEKDPGPKPHGQHRALAQRGTSLHTAIVGKNDSTIHMNPRFRPKGSPSISRRAPNRTQRTFVG